MPAHLILVHGEANNMSRLRSALKTKFAERKDDIQIYTPRNVEIVKLKFRGERMAKVRRPSRLLHSSLNSAPGTRNSGPRRPDPRINSLRPPRLQGLHLHFPRPLRPSRIHRTQYECHHAATTDHRLGHLGPRAVASAGDVRQDPRRSRCGFGADDEGTFFFSQRCGKADAR